MIYVKYIYFDCYAGFDVQMALGSLVDMTKDKTLAQNTALCMAYEATIFTEDVKRQGMDACLACYDFYYPEEQPIIEIIENCTLEDDIKSKLKQWYKLKSDGKARDFQEEFNELVYAAACFSIIKEENPDAVFVSAVYQGSGVNTSDGSFALIPSAHTELLAKMADLHISPYSIDSEILTPGGIALLYVLEAKYMSPGAHNVIKSGYGAGSGNLSIPNIARCILANKDETTETKLNFEAMISEMYAEIGSLAKTK